MREVVIGGIYKHFKGNDYKVLNVGKLASDSSDVVIYMALYGKYDIWVRNKDEFLSKVDKEKYPDVKQVYRFELKK